MKLYLRQGFCFAPGALHVILARLEYFVLTLKIDKQNLENAVSFTHNVDKSYKQLKQNQEGTK